MHSCGVKLRSASPTAASRASAVRAAMRCKIDLIFEKGFSITSVRLGIEQIHLVIERIVVIFVFCSLKSAGKRDFFERVNGQNL